MRGERIQILQKWAVIGMRRPRNFRQGGGGVQVSLTKKSSDNVFFFFFCFFFLLFFSPQLILKKSNGQFQRNLSYFKAPEGVQHFPGGGGGGLTFSRGGGVQLLIH